MYKILFIVIASLAFNSNANSNPQSENSYSLYTGDMSAFKNEREMVNHLKTFKSQTYKYYVQLTRSSKDRVYQEHIRNDDKNLTHIVLELYLAKS